MANKKGIVVGGGAAGLCCAGFMARQGLDVLLLERNARCARKVLITGKGRCNVTNNCSADEFIQHVRTNPRFLFGAVHAFPPKAAMELFESLGVPLKTERGRRVFPVSDKASDIAGALMQFAHQTGVQIVNEARVHSLLQKDGTVYGVRCEDGRRYEADAVVIATGGRSYPATGATGDGYQLAAQAGHTIVPQRPSLVPLVIKERWCADAMGLALKNVKLSLCGKQGKILFEECGEMLFTHFGVSGPLVLSASAYMAGSLENYRLEIDLKPGLSDQQLDARLLRDFAANKNKDFANSLGELLPRKLIPVIVALSGVPPETKVHSITQAQRRALGALLHALPLTPKAFRSLDEAVITSGGVPVKELNPKTMESKLAHGLYFAGEVIDVDAFTGGYNLQIAYCTAYAAASAVARSLKVREELGKP